MTTRIETRERIEGALVGLAIGDALGAPVEHMDQQAIATAYPLGVSGYVDRPPSGVRPGQGTDDTEMAFLVADSIATQQRLDMEDIVVRLITWGRDYPALGPSTGAGIAALIEGTPWDKAGQTATASSGCLPRCAPVALVATPSRLVTDTLRCCQPTHRHPLALAASVAQNLVLERLIRGLSWEVAYAVLTDGADTPVDALALIQDALRGEFSLPGAVDVLAEAVRCVNSAPDAESAVLASVLLGGDTDTRGAVAGALAGARWGISSFPQQWIDGCEASVAALSLGSSLAAIRHTAFSRGA